MVRSKSNVNLEVQMEEHGYMDKVKIYFHAKYQIPTLKNDWVMVINLQNIPVASAVVLVAEF